MKSSELVRLLKKDGWFATRQSYDNGTSFKKKGQIVCPYQCSHEVGKELEKKIKKMRVLNKNSRVWKSKQ